MREKRLIDASPIMDFIERGLNDGTFGHDAIEIMTEIEYAPTEKAVPCIKLLEMRNKFYENDGISFGNYRMLNRLIAEYNEEAFTSGDDD